VVVVVDGGLMVVVAGAAYKRASYVHSTMVGKQQRSNSAATSEVEPQTDPSAGPLASSASRHSFKLTVSRSVT